ncbi:hypothetical protein WJX72_000428 [[Myrmecia] bisecta]|uniref:Patatin n=1 Tax=[Myrmecia] bisecta TaxID=41462 RepID=A0AAW1QPF6_9CHLO
MPAREVRVQTQSQAYRCFENNGRQEQESSPLRSTIEITCVSLAESLGLRVWGKRLVGRGVPDAVIWFVTSERAFTLQVVSKQAAATAQDDDCIELEEACLPLGGVVLEVVKFGCPVLGWSLTAEEVQELEIDAGRLVRADYPPLFLAALQGDLSEVDKLISHGADINAPCRDSRTALCVAAARGDLNMVMVMVSHGAQVDIADRYGRTPLYVAARYAHEAVVEYLTKSGANVDQADTYGWTPLYAAAQAGNLSVVTVLQQAGADQDRASHCGWTPLYVAKQNGLDAIVDQLMKASSRRGRSHRDPGEEIVPADEHTINMEPQPSSSRHTTSQKDSQGSTAEYVKAAQPFVDKVLGLEQGLKQYSDLTSTDNNGKTIQWVDIVMAGGGMLGIAHVGATYVFERAGLRFHSIGGASAGAINAALVVTKRGPRPDAESSLETLKTMAALDFKEFQDDKDGQALLKDFREDNADGTLSFWEQAKLLVFHVGAIMRAISRQGLHSGKYFENWITKEMTNGGITNVDQLNDRLNVDLNSVRSLQLREGRVQNLSEDESKALLNDVGAGKMVIIASDITTATKAQFPENAKLYFNQPGRVHPGIFVRASMAVPGFFAPVVLPNATSGDLPTGATAEQAWKDDVGFEPTLETPGKPRFPNKIKFVDGGVLSNFPINAFHNKDRVPVLPTFGVCFGTSRTAVSASYTESNGILNFLGAIFDSSRQILDRDFLLKNPDYRQLITTIDASGFDWLDFDLSETRKVELFAQGAKAAAEFLVSFDWEKYKKTREFLLQARQAGSNLSNKIP